MCRFIANERCNINSIITRPFPSNEEELQNACSNLTMIKECITECIKNCSETILEDEYSNQEDLQNMTEEELKWEEDMIRRILKDDEMLTDAATEICQEDSKLHANIVPIISCYRNIFDTINENQMCKNYTGDALNFLQDLIDNIRREGHGRYNHHYYCLESLFDINCFVNEINKSCGPLAKDTALEIIEKGYNLDILCPVPMIPEILELLDEFETTTNEDMFVRNLL
ncbi:unnamed protein product, partial [Larinioides sclopetarius]